MPQQDNKSSLIEALNTLPVYQAYNQYKKNHTLSKSQFMSYYYTSQNKTYGSKFPFKDTSALRVKRENVQMLRT